MRIPGILRTAALLLVIPLLADLRPGAVDRGPVDRGAAPRAADDRSFTIAVVPDTQNEVLRDDDPRMAQRMEWLVSRREALDLRFVAHVGDLTNWGWLDPPQLDRASAAFAVLDRADVPYSIAIGNHDTRAVGWNGRGGYGGSAYVYNPECRQRFSASECRSPVLLRRTEEINTYFDADRFGAVTGSYEPGKIDNVYSTFRAARSRWLVLDLELWPRVDVVEWANRVVADHPRHNVMINTHGYLSGSNARSDSKEYGSTSPQYLWDNLVKLHANVRVVVCGHAGRAGMRVEQGVHGNTVVSLRTTFRSSTTNPVRLVTIRPDRDVLRTRITAPATGETYPKQSAVVRGMDFVD